VPAKTFKIHLILAIKFHAFGFKAGALLNSRAAAFFEADAAFAVNHPLPGDSRFIGKRNGVHGKADPTRRDALVHFRVNAFGCGNHGSDLHKRHHLPARILPHNVPDRFIILLLIGRMWYLHHTNLYLSNSDAAALSSSHTSSPST